MSIKIVSSPCLIIMCHFCASGKLAFNRHFRRIVSSYFCITPKILKWRPCTDLTWITKLLKQFYICLSPIPYKYETSQLMLLSSGRLLRVSISIIISPTGNQSLVNVIHSHSLCLNYQIDTFNSHKGVFIYYVILLWSLLDPPPLIRRHNLAYPPHV